MDASLPMLAVLAVLAALVSWRLTVLAIAYAHRVQLVDAPGARRSHAIPTPRGGGAAIVVAVLAFGTFPIFDAFWWRLVAAILAVAAIGWIDDHRTLGALPRFAVHVVASVLVALQALAAPLAHAGPLGAAIALGAVTFALAWSINLHNFMDGINGLLASQAAFVGVVAAACALHAGDAHAAFLATALAAAALGFLPLNFPQARIFMGDVGSGAIGLVVGWQLLRMALGREGAGAALIVCSAFAIDATLTLLSRMAAGKRWYEPHREHLYQWLVRSGLSHGQVVGYYALWNVLVVVPALVLQLGIVAARPIYSAVVPAAVLALGVVVWFRGKRSCLNRVKN